MSDFPWYPQIDGCRECDATDADACACERPPRAVLIAALRSIRDNSNDPEAASIAAAALSHE